jgi:hypothetical protein
VDTSNSSHQGTLYTIYVEQLREIEFSDEIVRIDKPLTSVSVEV